MTEIHWKKYPMSTLSIDPSMAVIHLNEDKINESFDMLPTSLGIW